MANNNGNNDRRPEFSITFKEMGGICIFLGSIVSAWVSLNSSQVETDTKLAAFETYYMKSLKEYKASNEKALAEMKLLINDQKSLSNELGEQLDDLERSVTQIYRLSTRKK